MHGDISAINLTHSISSSVERNKVFIPFTPHEVLGWPAGTFYLLPEVQECAGWAKSPATVAKGKEGNLEAIIRGHEDAGFDVGLSRDGTDYVVWLKAGVDARAAC